MLGSEMLSPLGSLRYLLLICLKRHLNQETVKWSSNQAVTSYYQSNHSKVVEAIPLSALAKDTISELSGLSLHSPFNAERQEGSSQYQLLKSFGLTRRGNRTHVY